MNPNQTPSSDLPDLDAIAKDMAASKEAGSERVSPAPDVSFEAMQGSVNVSPAQKISSDQAKENNSVRHPQG